MDIYVRNAKLLIEGEGGREKGGSMYKRLYKKCELLRII